MLKKIIILILGLIFLSGCSIKNCNTDLECFKESAKTCSKVRVNLIEEKNNIRVTVRGLTANSCSVSFKLEEISDDIKKEYPLETRIAKGKTLNCLINKKYTDYEQPDYIDEIFHLPQEFETSCSGPIKDLMKGPLKEIVINEFNRVINE